MDYRFAANANSAVDRLRRACGNANTLVNSYSDTASHSYISTHQHSDPHKTNTNGHCGAGSYTNGDTYSQSSGRGVPPDRSP